MRRLLRKCVVAALVAASAPGVVRPAACATVRYRNTDPSVPYASSKSCAGCHDNISRNFRRTPMGSSMAPASSPAELARVAQPATIYNADFDRYFRVFREGADIYQSEYQTD